MTFHSLPGTDSEVGEYASTHDHIGQLCSLIYEAGIECVLCAFIILYHVSMQYLV